MVLRMDLWDIHFLVPPKKRTKEGGWGEALTAKSFVTAVSNHHFYPNLEPPSPQTPLPAPVEGLGGDRFLESVQLQNKFDHSMTAVQCRKGYIGEGGSKPGKNETK